MGDRGDGRTSTPSWNRRLAKTRSPCSVAGGRPRPRRASQLFNLGYARAEHLQHQSGIGEPDRSARYGEWLRHPGSHPRRPSDASSRRLLSARVHESVAPAVCDSWILPAMVGKGDTHSLPRPGAGDPGRLRYLSVRDERGRAGGDACQSLHHHLACAVLPARSGGDHDGLECARRRRRNHSPPDRPMGRAGARRGRRPGARRGGDAKPPIAHHGSPSPPIRLGVARRSTSALRSASGCRLWSSR